MDTVGITNVNGVGLAFTSLLCVLTLTLPRKHATIPFLIIGSYMTLGQVLYIGGLHFTMLRVLILFGWLRLIIRHEIKKVEWNTLDKVFLSWLLFHVVVFIAREQTTEALINKLGFAYNAAGLYFLFRYLISGFDDYEHIISAMAIIVVPLTLLYILEMSTERNLFSIFGGVPEYPEIRDGRVRCQGPFRHPILAGTFAATFLPLFVALCFKKDHLRRGLVAAASALFIIIASGSGGPLLALTGVIIGLTMWPLRKRMKLVRWTALAALLGLHAVMKAPIWFIFSKMSPIVGGTGWHRSELIDQAINHIDGWWLVGTSVSNTVEWFPYYLSLSSAQADITNQYISEGINGGLVVMFLFISIIVISYKIVGHALSLTNATRIYHNILIWCLGVSLFAHVLSFFSVTYYDQMIVYWYLTLAAIAVLMNNNCPSSDLRTTGHSIL